MKNYRTKTIFYLTLKHVHKYGSAKYEPNLLFSSQQIATESVAEEKKRRKKQKKKKKKSASPWGIPSGDGMPQSNMQTNETLMPNVDNFTWYRTHAPSSITQ